MGELIGREIILTRTYIDPDAPSKLNLNYKYTYPQSVYAAIHQTMDETSPTLEDELAAIYRLINDKQDIIDSGLPGQVMLWSGVRGQIGSMEVVRTINADPGQRSNSKLASERAIGSLLDNKVNIVDFNMHSSNTSIHISDVERTRWNQMAPLSTLQAHMANLNAHITEADRKRWNAKADGTVVDDHIYNVSNPHNVTAHQAGTYTQREIDEMFENLRESFFNYKNIFWDDRNNQAKLTDYVASQWNPNYILEFADTLPDVPDPSLTYFALKPATDYNINETGDCIIYIKSPGLSWQEVGLETMSPGDMVIQYPDTIMYVWIQGRFMKLFAGESNDVIAGDGTSDQLWKPVFNSETGMLSWVRAKADQDPPAPMKVKGEDGYTPVKGVDYDDGKDGEGLAVGGKAGELLVKLTDENFDTTWTTIVDILNNLVVAGTTLPDGLVNWDGINGRPIWYNELGPNEDGFITQSAATRQFEIIGNDINRIKEMLDGESSNSQNIYDHVNNYDNPHRVTCAKIGAVDNATFLSHTQNFNNPHNVTAAQVGLGKVDNTSDLEKPISVAVQAAIDEINRKIASVTTDVDDSNYIVNAEWKDSTCDIIFTFKDDSELAVHVPIPDIFQDITYDNNSKELVITLPDGTENRIDVGGLIVNYFGSKSTHIQVIVDEDDHTISATVVPDSIGEYEITPSVHLRGAPTTVTQPVNDRSTRLATTEFVKGIVIDNLSSYETDRPLSANMGRILDQNKADIEDIIQIVNDLKGIEVIDSLESTNPLASLSANMGRYLDNVKSPTVHTSPSGSTYGRATISLFGHARASDEDPEMDGTVFRGIDNGYFAREGHRHPTDITRAPIHWPDLEHNQVIMTGEPRAETPPDDSNDTRIATTEWIRRNAVGVSFGRCSTPTTMVEKIVVLESTYLNDPVFDLQKGSTVCCTFAFDATPYGVDKAANKTEVDYKLNVQNTSAYPIRYGGQLLRSEMIKAGYSYTFTWDGMYWQLQNPTATQTLPDSDYSNSLVSSEWVRRNSVGVNYGVCTTYGTTKDKEATLYSTFCNPVAFLRQQGSSVAIMFSETDSSSLANVTTLNVNGTGAAIVKYGGRNLPSGYLGANYCHMFVFDGIYWQLINPADPKKQTEGGAWEEGPVKVLNQASGIFGLTTIGDTDSNARIDPDGNVNKIWFNLSYSPRDDSDQVSIKFWDSNHDKSEMADAWAALMGNGSIINLNTINQNGTPTFIDPRVINIGHNGCTLEFTMKGDNSYPVNAPCQLLYRTNKAWYEVLP